MKKYDLAVAYRIYPRVSKIPAMHPQDKFALSELCLRSFRASLGNLRVKMYALLDQCPAEYESLFLKHFDPDDLELIRLPGIGNLKTFQRQIELLLEQKHADAVYFAEDDYFYRKNEFSSMLDFLRQNPDADFVSPYDHPDYYSLSLHPRRQEIRAGSSLHWRTASSTCLTFLTTKKALAKTAGIFSTYSSGNFDVSLWLALTKQCFDNPAMMLRFFSSRKQDSSWYFSKLSWKHCWSQIVFGSRYRLWIPIPSIATHMEKACLAPGIDWVALFNEESFHNASPSRLQHDQ
jgi:hypothetical protein